MKLTMYDSTGKKKSEVQAPAVLMTPIREDLALKAFEALKFRDMNPYGPYKEAGKRHSASGTISHKRHEWKGHYGKGISRAPRKTMWRRGTQFYWIGTEVSQARGGRRAHPPKPEFAYRKINKKEMELARNICFASTLHPDLISRRYSSLNSKSNIVGSAIESLPTKTKELLSALKNIFGDKMNLIVKNKSVRAGKGKKRGRRYKSNAGILIVKSETEKSKFSGVDVKSLKEVKISDIYPLGRITLYTKVALDEMSKLGAKK